MEERRVRWTTYSNLSLWFNQWETSLQNLGFGSRDATGKFVIHREQLSRIINIDETALSFDGSEGRCGGRPAVEFFDPTLQASHKRTSKSSVTITLIAGSSAAGEAIPPHFQFPTRAKGENAKIDVQVYEFVKGVLGKFGCEQAKVWQSTIGMNNRGGMDTEEFEKYVLNNILRLYPDAADISGHKVILKCDGGPGRFNETLLGTLRARGFYLYPCVPNTTAITQETDQSFGLFKSVFRKSLKKLTDDRLARGLNVSFKPSIVGVLVFGGIDHDTEISDYEDAYAIAFSAEKNAIAWAAVGAAPLTRKCLASKEVRHNTKDAPMHILHKNIEDANHLACQLLMARGFKGEALKIFLKTASIPFSITVPNSKERQEAILAGRN